jgi:addiction module RelE/StbE family toxin
MNVQFNKNFIKQYKKRRAIQKQIDERLALFRVNPFDLVLNNHGLSGKYKGFRSINITGDYRAIYELIDRNTARFIDLDTHSNLYG